MYVSISICNQNTVPQLQHAEQKGSRSAVPVLYTALGWLGWAGLAGLTGASALAPDCVALASWVSGNNNKAPHGLLLNVPATAKTPVNRFGHLCV